MKNLYAALIKFQATLKPIAKTKTVSFGNTRYSYADLTEIWDSVRSSLAENKLGVTQLFDTSTEGDQLLVTILVHESGESERSRCKIVAIKNDPQSFGSAITYLRRYAFSAILGLTTEEDDDGARAMPSIHQETIQTPRQAQEVVKQRLPANAEWPKCSVCGTKMMKSKFSDGPEFYCPNKKNHKAPSQSLPPPYEDGEFPF